MHLCAVMCCQWWVMWIILPHPFCHGYLSVNTFREESNTANSQRIYQSVSKKKKKKKTLTLWIKSQCNDLQIICRSLDIYIYIYMFCFVFCSKSSFNSKNVWGLWRAITVDLKAKCFPMLDIGFQLLNRPVPPLTYFPFHSVPNVLCFLQAD